MSDTDTNGGGSVSIDPAKELLDDTRTELKRADDKATILLSVNGLLISALLAALLAGHFEPNQLDNKIEWLFWTGAVCLLTAEALLCAAVFPQYKRRRPSPSPRYFGDVVRLSRQQLEEALAKPEDPAERALDELSRLAPVALNKYRLIAAGEVTLAVGVIGCGAAALFG
jgi:hypothetical protein